jgi:site-specific recombinase XerD
MIRARNTPDGLPFRVYERYGARLYSIGYKMKSGRWAFKYRCLVDDANQIRKLRRDAIEESTRIIEDIPEGGFKGLVDAWFEWQEALPETSANKRQPSTIDENRREAAMLLKSFGHLEVAEITRTMGYQYLEAHQDAGRPLKANKEIALARLILEYAIRKGMIESNPFHKITHNKVIEQKKRYVTDDEMEIVQIAGKWAGPTYEIIALALKTAYLCVRRSVEVRKIARDSITDTGIVWTDSKDQNKPKILIEWSPELRETIDKVLAIKRNNLAGSFLLFGNLNGQRYTKSGWGKLLGTLMADAEELARAMELPFEHFSLQDCRPKGVSDKLAAGHTDTQDATLHSDGKMIARIYDRRANKKATPAG